MSARLKALLVALAALTILLAPLPLPNGQPQARTLRIYAGQYAFTPAEIYANPGDTITIELVASDVAHGLAIDGSDFTLTADPGQTTVGTFVAGQPGVYRLRCSLPCGNLHPFMLGKLRVGPNPLLFRGAALLLLALVAGLGLGAPRQDPPAAGPAASLGAA